MKLNEDLLTVAFSNIYENNTACLMVTRRDSDGAANIVNLISGIKAVAIYKAMIGEGGHNGEFKW